LVGGGTRGRVVAGVGASVARGRERERERRNGMWLRLRGRIVMFGLDVISVFAVCRAVTGDWKEG
jgi:hypothetical protein